MSFVRGMTSTAMQVGAAMSVGDLVGQGIEKYFKGDESQSVLNDVQEIDWARTARMGATGLCVSGPWNHVQHQALNRLFPGSSNLAVAKKVASGVVLAPIGISLMFSSVLALKGESKDIGKKLSKDGVETWVASSMFWPAVMTLNFKTVPESRQPLVAALAGSTWNIFSSYQANKNSALPVREVIEKADKADADATS